MARPAGTTTTRKNQGLSTPPQKAPGRTPRSAALSLGDQLFAIATRRYKNAANDLLPAPSANKAAIEDYLAVNREAIAKLHPVTQPEPEKEKTKLLTGLFGKRKRSAESHSATQNIFTNPARMNVLARAAVLLAVLSSGFAMIHFWGDDSIRIEDEHGISALNGEFGHEKKPVSLRVMRRRHKIGEITVSEGSKLRVVKATNGDAFRSEMAFTGNEANFKLKYKGKASVIVNNGPFKAKVRIAQGKENDVHLRFKELGQPMPVGEPKFEIEVIKGNVQIAEVDDDDDFEQFKAGEKAIFSLSPDSESL